MSFDAGICCDLFLVEALDCAKSLVGAQIEFLIAFHLKRCEVEETWRGLLAGFFSDIGHSQRGVF